MEETGSVRLFSSAHKKEKISRAATVRIPVGSGTMKQKQSSFRLYRDLVKRGLDFSLAGLAFVALSPVIGVSALLVRTKLGSPVLFEQVRPGKNEKIFRLYKFRSMTNAVDETGMLLPDEERLTKFGRFIRSSSIDELPELINILRGDMSIVGPRPLSVYYLPHYSDETRRRHQVRPGLTGLAQVNGRNNLDWEERFSYDIDYVDNVSFLGDVRIILKTALKVLKSEDIAVRGTTEVRDFGPYSTIKEEGAMTEKRSGMTYSEIGSYFWLEEQKNPVRAIDWLPPMSDAAYTFSGRAAIDLALRDLMLDRPVKKLYAPSYCCISMLQSFLDRNIEVKFYDVTFKDGAFCYKIDSHHGCDAALVMSYFGLTTDAERELIEQFHSQGTAVIEDVTHSLLREDACSSSADYAVASLRKWFAVPAGGWVGKRSGTLGIKPNLESDHAVDGKLEGMRQKYAYLSGKVQEKENFLALQAKFDTDLIHIDRLLKIDSVSMDILSRTDMEELVRRRRENAEILLKGLRDLPCVTLPQVDLSKDVPLFLPVFLPKEDRDALRAWLIARGMYCPVHWPEVMGAKPGVRNNELSLICDQRYRAGDMQAMVDEIHAWYDAKVQKDGK